MIKLTEEEVEKRTHSNKMTALAIVSLIGICGVWPIVGWIYDLVVNYV